MTCTGMTMDACIDPSVVAPLLVIMYTCGNN